MRVALDVGHCFQSNSHHTRGVRSGGEHSFELLFELVRMLLDVAKEVDHLTVGVVDGFESDPVAPAQENAAEADEGLREAFVFRSSAVSKIGRSVGMSWRLS